jgi:hypothetical protein
MEVFVLLRISSVFRADDCQVVVDDILNADS